jgi:hypothetical protein
VVRLTRRGNIVVVVCFVMVLGVLGYVEGMGV